MTRICPQCSLENNDQSVFCSRCGFRFTAVEDVIPLNNYGPTPLPATSPNAAYSGYAAQANYPQQGDPQSYEPSQPPAGPVPYTPQPPQPSPTPAESAAYGVQPGGAPYGQPGVPAYGASANDPYGAPGAAYQQQQMQPPPGQPGMQPPPGQPYFQPAGRYNAGQGLSAVQRAFAGRGTPLMHTSWLLDGKKVSPIVLRSTIMEKVQQRYPSEVRVSQERLSERDAVLEERDYARVERASTNVFIYVAPFGNDLYISRTTTVQPTLSPVRIAVLAGLFLLMIIGFIVSDTSASSAVILLFSALLLIFFVAIALHSLVLGFTEKDFLAYLRPNILNDFRIDDGAMLEHIVDKGIHEAAEGFGLDANALSAPAHNYPARQPMRFI